MDKVTIETTSNNEQESQDGEYVEEERTETPIKQEKLWTNCKLVNKHTNYQNLEVFFYNLSRFSPTAPLHTASQLNTYENAHIDGAT